ncbi:MAG: tRNA pseudouridine(38-40) synthase TruA [Deltaproteobacteria bacterium]|nr:tRNA pseudouridine(38-40) synthase TruA [Deltaproteobacteria bacterium]
MTLERSTATWRLVVAYRGAGFAGFAAQRGERTVQGELERALSALAGEPVRVRGAGRTDAGVHARGQVVSARFASRVPVEKMVLACNSQLANDLAVLRADAPFEGFDAKRFSVGKRYVYRVHTQAWHDPFAGATSWHVRQRLDVDAMIEAAAAFVGERDFESFRSQHCDAAHARRYLWRSEVRHERGLLEYEVRGNAFCRHMVRCLAGTLVDVGRGRFTPADMTRLLDARDRAQAGVTAPAQGLTLEEVYYPDALAHAGIPADATFPGFPVTAEDWPVDLPPACG